MRAITISLSVALVLSCSLALAGEVKLSSGPTVNIAGGKTQISFTLGGKGDVEVAILDAKGKVVRHLAAGVLGAKAPPPAPLKPGLSQKITWDGKDDYRQAAKGGPFKVRVRAGMGAKLEKIAGGDPYAYYSREMGQGDHSTWCITGIDAKRDGKVYVMGNGCCIGPATIRQYDAEGNFLKTVFPPPAGLPIDKVKGWGINAKTDGTYSFKYKNLATPKLSTTIMHGKRSWIADLIPSPEPNKLLISLNYELMTLNTDGTIPANAMTGGRLVKNPAPVLPGHPSKWPWKLTGERFVTVAPDGKSFYLSGIYAGTMQRSRCLGAEKEGFWRDGQVFKVSLPDRTAKPFFALDANTVLTDHKARTASPIGDTRSNPYAALHGTALDKSQNLFVCDRQNKRIAVLDRTGKVIREIPVANPDAVAVSPDGRSIYVTTRSGNYHKKGELSILKFNDWTKDTKPAISLRLDVVGTYPHRSYLSAVKSKGMTLVWVAYTTLPVRIFQDTGAELKVKKNFYHAGSRQRCLDLNHFAVDPKTEDIYVPMSFKNTFVLKDWEKPIFERAMIAAKKGPAPGRCACYQDNKLRAISVAIDYRNRYLYTHDYIRSKIKHSLHRYKMDGEFYSPAPIGDTGSHAISGQRVSNDWRIGPGLSQRGIAVAPCGCVAALGSTAHTDYSGPLYIFKHNEKSVPWTAMHVPSFGARPNSGGIRFDAAGNLYVGKLFRGNKPGIIVKYTPTGALKDGCLYPTPPGQPAKVYSVNYGYPASEFARSPRFGVDGYGRISFPTSLEPKVTLIDNAGNQILSFGTYGNRDSMGGLEGDLVPTKGVPLAFPNSVDATDDYIYVSDMVNVRLLRLAKTFAAEKSADIR